MQNLDIAFIGSGNMAEAMISGLIRAGHDAARIRISDPQAGRMAALQQAYGVVPCKDNVEAVIEASAVVLAVKPQQVAAALGQVASRIKADATVVSIAAGIQTEALKPLLGEQANIVRSMPNTPALVGAGVSVLFSDAGDIHRQRAEYILSTCGETYWVDKEKMLHAVTAVSGSGPAYFFLLAEIMQAAGESLGLPADLALRLASQTAFGSGKMLVASGRTPAELRQQVTSPGGTTQAALDVMYEKGVPAAVRHAIMAASKRSIELGG